MKIRWVKYFILVYSYSQVPIDLIKKCGQYNIREGDCLNSSFIPNSEYIKYLQSFNMPILKDDVCSQNKCMAIVSQSPEQAIRQVPQRTMTSTITSTTTSTVQITLSKSLEQKTQTAQLSDSKTQPTKTVTVSNIVPTPFPQNTTANTDSKIQATTTITISKAIQSTCTKNQSDKKDTDREDKLESIKRKKPKHETEEDSDETNTRTIKPRSTRNSDKYTTVTREIVSTVTVEAPITLYREMTTTSVSKVPIINYKVTTLTSSLISTSTVEKTLTETVSLRVPVSKTLTTTVYKSNVQISTVYKSDVQVSTVYKTSTMTKNIEIPDIRTKNTTEKIQSTKTKKEDEVHAFTIDIESLLNKKQERVSTVYITATQVSTFTTPAIVSTQIVTVVNNSVHTSTVSKDDSEEIIPLLKDLLLERAGRKKKKCSTKTIKEKTRTVVHTVYAKRKKLKCKRLKTGKVGCEDSGYL